ncbi:hypothetical protein [Bradyrhizobium sp. McL0616]|uniref:hypothetical protein n=1 Tax=Bradyrhizobium sp. McL0616 TaxID=3415674 RepID=UPI003CEFCCFA
MPRDEKVGASTIRPRREREQSALALRDQPSNSERDQRGAAYHEAGHIVVAWVLRLAIGGAEIAIDSDPARGATQIQDATHLSLLDQLAICAAGLEAQKLFDAPTHEGAGWGDYGKMIELLDDVDESEDVGLVHQGHERALALLRPHLDIIERIAKALIERKCLDTDEVRDILEG